MDSDYFAALASHPLFAHMPEETRGLILRAARPLKLDANRFVFQQGGKAEYFYLVVSGKVRLFFSSPDGKEKTVRFFEQGRIFAEALMFMQRETYPANAMTVEPSVLLPVRNEAYRNALLENPAVAFQMLGRLSEHLHAISRQVEMLSVFDAGTRVLTFLSQHLPPDAAPGSCYPQPMSKKALAEYLAIRPETLSRLLKQFEQAGYLRWKQDVITVDVWPLPV
ncbi:MAG: Crp/Fnr family transcriptional regulator [Cardiobacteriaceae bacterium]|nr:Crp/Fnr family transcriptional regulator [Cardiobacteriaceae bacterium]